MDYQLGPGPLQVDQNTTDEKIKGDIGIVENGDIATHAILKDYYVIWKGNLYKAKTDISSGTTLSAESNGNLDPKSNGLGGEVAALNSNLASNKIKAIAVSANVTCGNAVAHFPGSGTANVGLGTVNFINDVPSGGTFFALIPGQATRASGVDVAYSIVPDNSASSIRIYGTANQTYAVTATLLYF